MASADNAGACNVLSRHRAAEFRRFSGEEEADVRLGLDDHLVMDYYATDRAPAVKTYLLKRCTGMRI